MDGGVGSGPSSVGGPGLRRPDVDLQAGTLSVRRRSPPQCSVRAVLEGDPATARAAMAEHLDGTAALLGRSSCDSG